MAGPQTLPSARSYRDAPRTEYSVVVLMAGLQPVADAAAFARLQASQQAYIRGLDLNKGLPLKALLVAAGAPQQPRSAQYFCSVWTPTLAVLT